MLYVDGENLHSFFDPVRLGQSLFEVFENVSDDDNKIIVQWYHSALDVDVLVWKNQAGSIVKQQVIFFGQVVEWSANDGLSTGIIVQVETNTNNEEDDELVIIRDYHVHPITFKNCFEILRNCLVISEFERQLLTSNFFSQ